MISISSLLELLGFILTCAGILVCFTRKFTSLESKHDHLRNEYDAAYNLFCKKNSEFEQQLEEQSRAQENVNNTIMAQLSSIAVSLAEIKTEMKLRNELATTNNNKQQ